MTSTEVLTPEFRISYANVFVPQKNELSGKMEYSLVMLFPKGADLSKLKAAAEAALVAKLGADKTKWPANMRNPFRKCSERWKNVDGKQVVPAGYEDGDAIFITAKSQMKPGVVDENVQIVLDAEKFYSGCYARAYINPYFYDNKGNRGVAFGLQRVQKVRNGDPLGGRSAPEAGFVAVEGAAAGATGNSVFD